METAVPRLPLLLCLTALPLVGCIEVRHKVDPIHATIDINLKIDRELDQFFDFDEPATDTVSEPTSPDA